MEGSQSTELIGGIEVEVVKKLQIGLTCTPTRGSVTIGDSVTITGTLTPTSEGVKIFISLVDPEGDTSQRTVSTASDGTYSDTFTPDLTGTWRVSSPGRVTTFI